MKYPLLAAALLGLLAINYKLDNTQRALTGDKSHRASWFERFVLWQSD